MPGIVSEVTPEKRARFVAALAKCGVVSYAARTAGFSRRHAYRLREADAEFAAEWDDAAEQAADRLEQEAFRRAHDGVLKPLTNMKGLVLDSHDKPVKVREYDTTLLIFLLKGMRPEKYRERNETKHTGTVNVQLLVQQVQTALEQALPDDETTRARVAEALLALDERTAG